MLNIYSSGENFFVWNAEDVVKLRKEHHIVGSLSGICPVKAFQVHTKWMPLLLMPEEAKLLLEKGIACLAPSPEKISDPDLIKSFIAIQDKLWNEQTALLKDNRRKIIWEKADEIFAGKKRKLAETTAAHKSKERKEISKKFSSEDKTAVSVDNTCSETALKQDNEGSVLSEKTENSFLDEGFKSTQDPEKEISEESVEMKVHDDSDTMDLDESKNESKSNTEETEAVKELDCDNETHAEANKDSDSSVKDSNQTEVDMLDKEAVIASELAKIPEISKDICMKQLFTECPLKNTKITAQLNYPSTDREKLRYAVFKDLWERQLFITGGLKFGGDFLAYEGDPMKYHASFIVICIPKCNKFQALDILTYGRLARQVKKTVALASLNESGAVEYISVGWCSDIP